MYKPHPLLMPLALAACGCATLDTRRDVERSARSVEEAVGIPGEYLLLDERVAESRTAELLEGGVSSEEAVKIALLNSPRVRAAMLSIGVSRADFVQSTLFTNPFLTLSLRLPDGGGLGNFETALSQSIAELWLIPARRLAAEHDLDRTVLEAARTAAGVALDVRSAYWGALGAERQQTIAVDNLSLNEQLVEAANQRQQAGSGNVIDVNLARAQVLNAATALRNAKLDGIKTRSDLARLMGLSIDPASLILADTLPESKLWTVPAEVLQQTAREHRLDLQIADKSVSAAEARINEERARFIKSMEVGFALERGERRNREDRNWGAETVFNSLQGGQLTPPNLLPREREGTDTIIGPTVGIELPLWDQNQAQIAKAEHRYQQAIQLREALLVDVTQDIHSGLARASTAAENARFYRDEQVPNAERNAELSRDAYRSGRLSLLSVLEAERNLLTTRSGYATALENAALAAVELERVTGRPANLLLALPEVKPAAAAQDAENEVNP